MLTGIFLLDIGGAIDDVLETGGDILEGAQDCIGDMNQCADDAKKWAEDEAEKLEVASILFPELSYHLGMEFAGLFGWC